MKSKPRGKHTSQIVWTVFKRDSDKQAGKVFIAMSFISEQALKNVGTAIDEALDGFNADHSNCPLAPLTFHKRAPTDKPPWERESSPGNKVHFDFVPYRYIAYESEFELRDKLKQELDAFFPQAS